MTFHVTEHHTRLLMVPSSFHLEDCLWVKQTGKSAKRLPFALQQRPSRMSPAPTPARLNPISTCSHRTNTLLMKNRTSKAIINIIPNRTILCREESSRGHAGLTRSGSAGFQWSPTVPESFRSPDRESRRAKLGSPSKPVSPCVKRHLARHSDTYLKVTRIMN